MTASPAASAENESGIHTSRGAVAASKSSDTNLILDAESLDAPRRTSHQFLPPIATAFWPSGEHPQIDTFLNSPSPTSAAAAAPSAQLPPSPNTQNIVDQKSPMPSAGSKTAAFFGSGGNNRASRPSSSIIDTESIEPGSDSIQDASASAPAMPSSSSASSSSWSSLQRDGSTKGSLHGRDGRKWDDFEGKPITPLPSPGIWRDEVEGQIDAEKRTESSDQLRPKSSTLEGRLTADPFDAEFGRRAGETNMSSSSRGSSRERNFSQRPSEGNSNALSQALAGGSLASFDTSLSDSFSSLPSTSSSDTLSHNAKARAARNGATTVSPDSAASTSASKTSAFFGTSWSLASAPSRSQAYGGEEGISVARTSPPIERLQSSPSEKMGSSFQQPSRLPSVLMESDSPEVYSDQMTYGTPEIESTTPSTVVTPTYSQFPPQTFQSITPLPSAVGNSGGAALPFSKRGGQRDLLQMPQLPSIHLQSPQSPPVDVSPAWESRDERHSRTSPRTRGTSGTRHVHGPSENASGSSLLPSVEVIKNGSGSTVGSVMGNDTLDDVKGHYASQQLSTADREGLVAARRDSSRDSRTVVGAATAAVESGATTEDEDVIEGKIGRYRIEKTLGVGAFSRVVLASQLPSPRRPSDPRANKVKQYQEQPTLYRDRESIIEASGGLVALKMLEKKPCMHNERMRVSWVREVEVLKHIVHPNIVRFISSFSTPSHHNLVLERVAGGELFDLLASKQLELASREWLVRRFFGELANAVGWMHGINLVHRDIKLENIILTRDLFNVPVGSLRPSALPSMPLVKLTDFGLSRFVDPNNPLLETRCGSEEYAAPELIIGKRYDGRKTDVWAMGVVLYALLTGALPFLDDATSFTSDESASKGGIGAREGAGADRDARTRKAHLLRIAKGDLRWPARSNDAALDKPEQVQAENKHCPPGNRLITLPAKHIVGKLLRRDAAKRASAWDVWDDGWMLKGSFEGTGGESSVLGDTFTPPIDPRSSDGQRWLVEHARVHSGVGDVAHDD